MARKITITPITNGAKYPKLLHIVPRALSRSVTVLFEYSVNERSFSGKDSRVVE
jgi:hypothetical protein